MLSIIVPAKNERVFIVASILEIISSVELLKINYEIIVIDDGSSDDTFFIVSKFIDETLNKNIKIFKNEKNLGLGGSYKKGLSLSNGEYITWVPADLSHDFKSLANTYKNINKAELIIPFPINTEIRSTKRKIISLLFIKLVNIITNNNIRYYNGLTVHRKENLLCLDIKSNGFTFQAEIIVKLLKKNLSFIEIGVEILDRKEGNSKAFTIKNYIQAAYFFMICLKYRK